MSAVQVDSRSAGCLLIERPITLQMGVHHMHNLQGQPLGTTCIREQLFLMHT
jgi:hypothetical protein